MDRNTPHTPTAPPTILSLVGQSDGDLGATLVRLAHLAAAQHRLASATQHIFSDIDQVGPALPFNPQGVTR